MQHSQVPADFQPYLVVRIKVAQGAAGEVNAEWIRRHLQTWVSELHVPADCVCCVYCVRSGSDGASSENAALVAAANELGVAFRLLAESDADSAKMADIVVGPSGLSGTPADSLRQLAAQIQAFRTECHERSIDAAAQLQSLLSPAPDRKPRPRCLLEHWMSKSSRGRQRTESNRQPAVKVDSPTATEKLLSLARFRKAASMINLEADRQVKQLRRKLLLMALAVILLLQFCQYWTPQPAAQSDRLLWTSLRCLAFCFGCFLFFRIWRDYLRSLRQRLSERQDDHRAIAEALRVQFFWTAAGINKTVATHYPLRHNRALFFIRAIVSSVAMPWHNNQQEFDALSAAEQTERLRQIHSGWIDQQRLYFLRKQEDLSVRQRWQSLFANGLFWSGLLQLIAAMLTDLGQYQTSVARVAVACWEPLLFGTVAAAALLFVLRQLVIILGTHPDAQHHQADGNLFNRLAALFERAAEHWGATAVFALTTAAALTALAFGAPEESFWLPPAGNFGQILRTLCFSLYAILLANMGFSFLSRNVEHYRGMAELYGSKMQSLKDCLDQLANATESQRAKSLEAIREHLTEIGREAVDENSDWLQMHRANPVAPVSLSP